VSAYEIICTAGLSAAFKNDGHMERKRNEI
jgi:hypothetical protein